MDNCHYQTSLREAINVVLDQDLPEECFVGAVTFQAGLMARIDPEEMQEPYEGH